MKMKMRKSLAKKGYKNDYGVRIPGVTTITGMLAKPALIPWANKMGLKGIDISKYVDDLAQVGKLAHSMVEHYLLGTKADTSDYSKNQISLAENAMLKFLAWEKENDLKVIRVELRLISEQHQFGGTCDIYCKLNGRYTLIDLKTSKGIWPDMFTQVAAYCMLLRENGYQVDDVRILRIGRDESEGFEDVKVPLLDLHWEKFLACLDIYNLNKQLTKH